MGLQDTKKVAVVTYFGTFHFISKLQVILQLSRKQNIPSGSSANKIQYKKNLKHNSRFLPSSSEQKSTLSEDVFHWKERPSCHRRQKKTNKQKTPHSQDI